MFSFFFSLGTKRDTFFFYFDKFYIVFFDISPPPSVRARDKCESQANKKHTAGSSRQAASFVLNLFFLLRNCVVVPVFFFSELGEGSSTSARQLMLALLGCAPPPPPPSLPGSIVRCENSAEALPAGPLGAQPKRPAAAGPPGLSSRSRSARR